jgi:nucleoside 2-deoxyribosyltransferase
MRAYITVKYHEDNRNREHIEAISSVLEERGFETVCITRDLERWGKVQFDAGLLMERAFREIDASDIVVVDLTEKGVGIGIEAGYAAAKSIPIVTIARTGSPISETLRGISREVFTYNQYDDLGYLFTKMRVRAE